MPDPNLPDDGTRRAPPRVTPPIPSAVKSTPTGEWTPAAPGIPQKIGRFEVRAVLGEGAFGRVFLAFDPELEREVAIKVPTSEGFTPEFREVFIRENRLAGIIHHANICPVYEVGTDGAVPYIVMRYVAGGTLAGLLKRLATPMPARNAVAIARKLALGLAAAHAQKIIHRDLKPANVLYDEANREVLLADFGLARFIDQASASSAGVPKGTPAYMAPEQARGLADVIGPHSDVYALGVMLYEMVTGRVPFTGSIWEVMRDHCETTPRLPSAVRPGLDTRIDTLCLKAMAKKPADRYASAKAFAAVLSDYLHGGAGGGVNEELMLAEEIGDDGPKPGVRDGSSSAAAFDLDDDTTEGPAHGLRETSIPSKGSGPVRQPAKPAAEEPKEVILCPKCRARMQVAASRAKPVDCPMCNCRFAVAAGRQALARSVEPKPKAKPVAPSSGKPRTQRPKQQERLSLDDDEPSRGEWLPVARGLRLAWIGTLLCGLCFIGLGITALASVNFDPPSTKSSGSSTSSSYESRSTYRDTSSGSPATALACSAMGLGIALGIGLTGIGRLLAARLPQGVRGGWLSTFSAVAGWLAALCVVVPSFLAYRLLEDTPSSRTETTALGAAAIALALALVLLLASDFAFTSYLAAIGREIGRRAPRHLTTLAKVILWIVLSCAVIGATSGGVLAALDERKSAPGVTFFAVLAGAAGCFTVALLPFWGATMFVLHARAAVVVGAYARTDD